MNYKYYSELFKVLSDSNRLKIIDLIASKETCACNVLKEFDITQPTFTHHISVLKKYDIIKSKKEGTKSINTLNIDKIKELKNFIDALTTNKECNCEEDCNCNKKGVKNNV